MEDTATRAPVKYLVLEKSLVGNELFEAGQTAMYAGLPGPNLEPTCDEGRARAAEAIEVNKRRVAAMIEANRDSAVGDPAAFAKAFAQELAAANAAHAEAQQAMLQAQAEQIERLTQALQTSQQAQAEMIGAAVQEAIAKIAALPAPAAAAAPAPASTKAKPAGG